MNTFTMIFLGICVILAVLLLTGVLTIVVASALFAVSLVVFGLASRRFGRPRK